MLVKISKRFLLVVSFFILYIGSHSTYVYVTDHNRKNLYLLYSKNCGCVGLGPLVEVVVL